MIPFLAVAPIWAVSVREVAGTMSLSFMMLMEIQQIYSWMVPVNTMPVDSQLPQPTLRFLLLELIP